jgi:hypothetical protein
MAAFLYRSPLLLKAAEPAFGRKRKTPPHLPVMRRGTEVQAPKELGMPTLPW